MAAKKATKAKYVPDLEPVQDALASFKDALGAMSEATEDMLAAAEHFQEAIEQAKSDADAVAAGD